MVILLWIVASGAVLAAMFRAELRRAWREPVLAAPVLIVESDDWGYGPLEQAARLREISELMGRHRDASGRPAVMTLGVVLGGPDTARMAADEWKRYHRLTLSDPKLSPVLEQITAGARHGVFALQLHGLEHYWPPALMKAAEQSDEVQAWLRSAELPATEALPSHLQSRWADASVLPSRALPPEAIERAAREEAQAFRALFGMVPAVVVPPTFVWTAEVEHAWSQADIRVVVTPGRRFGGRDAAGRPAPVDPHFHNAETARSGITYLVRDDYFEPALGHRAERALVALEAKTRLGRPTLLETHRANFLGDAKAADSLGELDRLLTAALRRWPNLHFMSSAELACHYRQRSAVVQRRLLPRLHCFVMRLAAVSRLRKLAWASGAALPAAALWLATRSHGQLRTARLH